VNCAHDVVHARVGYSETDIQLAGTLRDGDDTDVIARHYREKASQNAAGSFHARPENGNDRDVAVDGDRIQNSMFQFSSEQSLDCVNDALRVGFPKHQAQRVL